MPRRASAPADAPANTATVAPPADADAMAIPSNAPRMLRVLEWLETPSGGFWPPDTIIPMDALGPESISILMERQIVMVALSPAQIADLPLDAQ